MLSKKATITLKGVLILVFIISLCGILTSCGKKTQKEILIGTHLPLTGIGSASGIEQKWAYEQAVKDINDAGGIYIKEFDEKFLVKLLIEDDESDPKKAAAAVEKLIREDGVKMILGGQIGDQGVFAGMTTAESLQTYYHGLIIWKPMFLQGNFNWCTMYFEEIPDLGVLPYLIFNSLPEDKRIKNLGILMEDNLDGKSMGDGLEHVAKIMKYNVGARLKMKAGSKDYTSIIKKAKAAGVDGIICFGSPTDIKLLIKQMKENDFNVKAFQGFKGTWSQDFWDDLQGDAEGILNDGFWSEDYPYEGAKEIGERFNKEFGYRSVSIGLFYAACQTLWQAIEVAGTVDGSAIRQALIDNKFETVNGSVDYDEDGVAIFPPAATQWRDGKRELIFPFELTENKIEPIVPWSER